MTLEEFVRKLDKLKNNDIEQIKKNIMFTLGEIFLEKVINEIQSQDLIDTGNMWNSFVQNAEGNVWKFDSDKQTMTLEVGSNLPYARFLNDGYEIKKGRFVAGVWKNGKFKFLGKNAPKVQKNVKLKSGKTVKRMVTSGFFMKPRKFMGKKYFDIALKDFESVVDEEIQTILAREMKRLGL